jgi:aspartate kinase
MNTLWKVIKLGGTSQCIQGYRNIIKIIENRNENEKYIFVLSAVSGVTNLLEKFTNTKDETYIDEVIKKNDKLATDLSLIKTPNYSKIKLQFMRDCKNYKSTHDDIYFQSKIIGYGEVISTHILSDWLEHSEFNDIQLLNSYEFIFSKKETFKLYPLGEFYGDLSKFNNIIDQNKKIFISQGFIASSPTNNTILLGRGGSDTTGALISNMLNAEEYIVYTDVNGIYTTDPRICDKASIIKEIDYNIVQELSAMGAKVMHPSSILPCMVKDIPIKILNTFNDNNIDYTTIKKVNSSTSKLSAIALQKDVKLIRITSENMWNNYGFVYDIFRRFSERRIDVNIVSTSQFTISTTTEEKNKILIKDLIQDLEEKYTVELLENCSIVSIVTNYIPEIYKKLELSDIKHHLLSIGATNNSISFVIDEKDSTNAIIQLHNNLI